MPSDSHAQSQVVATSRIEYVNQPESSAPQDPTAQRPVVPIAVSSLLLCTPPDRVVCQDIWVLFLKVAQFFIYLANSLLDLLANFFSINGIMLLEAD